MIPERDDIRMVSRKPPLPPKPHLKPSKGSQMQHKTDCENIQQIQKLSAMNDKLNIEIGKY
jgi:hypothetical protein